MTAALTSQDGRKKAKIMSIVVRLLRDRSGAAAVEFAFIATPAILLLCTIMAVGLSFFETAALDHAALKGARAIATGSVSSADMTASSFQQNIICPSLPSMFNCSNVFVNLKTIVAGQFPSTYYGFVNSSQSGLIQPALNNTSNAFCPGAGSQYIVLQVLYPAPFWFSYLVPGSATQYNGKPVNVLMSTVTFKSEPYTGAATYTGC